MLALELAAVRLEPCEKLLLEEAIHQEAQTLSLQPLMGRLRPELAEGVRSWPTSTRYILFYVPADDGVTVLRVLHHARDIPNVSMS